MKKKYVIGIVIILILVLGVVGFLFLNNSKKNKTVNLKVVCGEETTTKEYKEGDTFSCKLLGDNYEMKVEKIEKDKIQVSASSYGLSKVDENGSINLLAKVKDFELNKDEKLVLAPQVTDAFADLTITWE